MVCRLCSTNERLCESHIVSEFFFKQLYDETHRYFAMSNSRGERIHLLQKGLREELLCPDCESRISSYESHACAVLYGGAEITVEKLGNTLRIAEIDYRKFKLFLLSMLWRLGVTSLPVFQGIKLGSHEDKLRAKLLDENPGEPWEYGCLITGLLHEGQVFKELITPPGLARLDGHHIYTTAIGGFLFSFFVSNHKPAQGEDAFVQKDGTLTILRKEFTEVPFLLNFCLEIGKAQAGKALPGSRKN